MLHVHQSISQRNRKNTIFALMEKGCINCYFQQQPKTKEFRRHCCNVLLPHVRQQLTNKMKEEKYATIALLNDDLKNREHKNVGLQGELKAKDQQIAALQRRYVDYLLDEDKNNGISIIVKNNEETEYQHISICGPHDYRRQKVRVLLPRNQGSTLFGDEDECYCYV